MPSVLVQEGAESPGNVVCAEDVAILSSIGHRYSDVTKSGNHACILELESLLMHQYCSWYYWYANVTIVEVGSQVTHIEC